MNWTRTAAMAVPVAAVAGAIAFAATQFQAPLTPLPNATVDATLAGGFQPAEVVIPQGGTVEWRNTALLPRTVTDDPAKAAAPADAQLPPGARPFDSGRIPAGRTWRRAFAVPGRYVYFSRPQEGRGMLGVVIVRGGG